MDGLVIVVLIILFVIGINIYLWFYCARLTDEKGYGSALGFLLGFFANIIGLVICLVLPENENKYSPRMGAPRGNHYNGHYQNRPPMNPRGRVNSRRPMNRGTRSGYRPVGNHPQNYEGYETPMQAIPKDQQFAQVACPHCNIVLQVSEHMEYTCPNCQKPFIY